MKKRIVFSAVIILLLLSAISIFIYFKYFPPDKDFETNRVFLKSVIKEGEKFNTTLRIMSLKENNQFEIKVLNLENLIFLSGKNFTLNNKETKDMEVSFNGENPAGIYSGSLVIKTDAKKTLVPVVLEIQSLDSYFAISTDVDPKYKEIGKGENIVSKINFFNLKDTNTHQVNVEYKILDSEGKEILSEKENITMGSRLSVTESLAIPKEAKTGSYVFAVILKFENSVSTSSYLFDVRGFRITFSQINIEIVTVAILTLLLIIVLIIIYVLYERDKLISELKKQQKTQIGFYSDRIERQKKTLLEKAGTEKQKRRVMQDYQNAKKKILKEIKKEHQEQRKEFRKLAGKEETKQVNEKLRKWRKQTYAKALEKAEISQKLKLKLATLKRAYSEGYISREAYKKGESRINRFTGKSKA